MQQHILMLVHMQVHSGHPFIVICVLLAGSAMARGISGVAGGGCTRLRMPGQGSDHTACSNLGPVLEVATTSNRARGCRVCPHDTAWFDSSRHACTGMACALHHGGAPPVMYQPALREENRADAARARGMSTASAKALCNACPYRCPHMPWQERAPGFDFGSSCVYACLGPDQAPLELPVGGTLNSDDN